MNGPIGSDERFLYLWWQLEEQRAAAEYALAHAIPCDPVAGVACARECGVTDRAFCAREDMRLIFLANELAGRFGRREAFRLARRAMTEESLWDEGYHRNCRGPRWSTASLGDFWNEFADGPTPMQPSAIRDRAHTLLSIEACQRDAVAHYRESLRLMEEGVAA